MPDIDFEDDDILPNNDQASVTMGVATNGTAPTVPNLPPDSTNPSKMSTVQGRNFNVF